VDVTGSNFIREHDEQLLDPLLLSIRSGDNEEMTCEFVPLMDHGCVD